jgi:uncharacterized protein YndB with AHSA1/START domain
MQTRNHVHEEELGAPPAEVFALLHTPSAIRRWWGAARAVVIAQEGGLWAAAWGEIEDEPDYIAAATLKAFDPPHRILLSDFRYYAKSGPLPFDAKMSTEFNVRAAPRGSVLRVVQDGFPVGKEADEYYAACAKGWRDTFAGLRRYLADRT